MWQTYAVRSCQLAYSVVEGSSEPQMKIEFENKDEEEDYENIGLDI